MGKQINEETYKSIITSIVVGAASQVDGIASVTFEPGIMTTISSKKKKINAIDVAIFNDVVTIAISVNVYYGKVIPVVICNLQEKIKNDVESATSLKVKTVNVTVVGTIVA